MAPGFRRPRPGPSLCARHGSSVSAWGPGLGRRWRGSDWAPFCGHFCSSLAPCFDFSLIIQSKNQNSPRACGETFVRSIGAFLRFMGRPPSHTLLHFFLDPSYLTLLAHRTYPTSHGWKSHPRTHGSHGQHRHDATGKRVEVNPVFSYTQQCNVEVCNTWSVTR